MPEQPGPAGLPLPLATVSSRPYDALQQWRLPVAEQYAAGKAMRARVPRSALGDWTPATGRADPVDLVTASHAGRVPELVAVRVSRMAASPYGFLRGSAVVMADDLAALPATDVTTVICGDAHVGNFGFYGSPERELVFDLNDFDEAHPGPWEWDVRRLATSIWVAGRQNGFSEQQCAEATAGCADAYRRQIRELAEQRVLARSFQRLDVDTLTTSANERSLREALQRAAERARTRTSDRALPRFTEERAGRRRIVDEPPLLTHLPDAEAEALVHALARYPGTLPSHWRRVIGSYSVVDVARKVVGVGSVGLRAYVALCEGSSPDDVLFLQLKQARRSVVAPHVHGEVAWHAHQGQRVVEYQQALQTVSDPLLGWTTVDTWQCYVRQFRNMKGSVGLDDIDAAAMADYAAICGRLLAKGHARTSGAPMIAGYVGSSDALADALTRFARAYADQTEADHQRFRAAAASLATG